MEICRDKTTFVRVGLRTDCVNPFGLHLINWSTWPVVLMNYNLPSWKSIKKGHLLICLLTPRKMKIKDMSMYLALFIDELKDLWEGIKMVDNLKKRHHKVFNLRAILMLAMHDYLGYGM